MKRIIVFFSALSFIFCLSGCKGKSKVSHKKNNMDILVGGIWLMDSVKEPIEEFVSGWQFAENHQVFYIDSQGRPIMSIHEHTFSLNGDTLTMIDHKYAKKVLKTKGTRKFIIRKISPNFMDLMMIYPNPKNEIQLSKRN